MTSKNSQPLRPEFRGNQYTTVIAYTSRDRKHTTYFSISGTSQEELTQGLRMISTPENSLQVLRSYQNTNLEAALLIQGAVVRANSRNSGKPLNCKYLDNQLFDKSSPAEPSSDRSPSVSVIKTA